MEVSRLRSFQAISIFAVHVLHQESKPQCQQPLQTACSCCYSSALKDAKGRQITPTTSCPHQPPPGSGQRGLILLQQNQPLVTQKSPHEVGLPCPPEPPSLLMSEPWASLFQSHPQLRGETFSPSFFFFFFLQKGQLQCNTNLTTLGAAAVKMKAPTRAHTHTVHETVVPAAVSPGPVAINGSIAVIPGLSPAC